MNELVIGIDGYDSPYAGCTTHFSTFLLKTLLEKHSFLFLKKHPYLVRLNPNIPWRTRGNASIGVRLGIETKSNAIRAVIETMKETAKKYMQAVENDKGTIIIMDDSQERFHTVAEITYLKALTDVMPREIVERQLESMKNIHILGKKSIVGALSAIGFMMGEHESTYELLAYRNPHNIGPRRLNDENIRILEKKYPTLFNNYDYRKKRAIAIPHGPDPVLIGLRGTSGCDLWKAFQELEVQEEVKGACLFITNQHTDAHAVKRLIRELRVYQTALVNGIVTSNPIIKKGGHVQLQIGDPTGVIKTNFFSESWPLNKIASDLRKGDYLSILGSVMPDKDEPDKIVLNAEKLWIEDTVPITKILNPRCPVCGKRMKSAGKKGGYKCPRCGYKTNEELEKELYVINRKIPVGPYTPENGRIRHLVKPAYLNELSSNSCLPEPMDACVFP